MPTKKEYKKFLNELNWNAEAEDDLSDESIRTFYNQVNWERISKCRKLTEGFIREFQDKVD